MRFVLTFFVVALLNACQPSAPNQTMINSSKVTKPLKAEPLTIASITQFSAHWLTEKT